MTTSATSFWFGADWENFIESGAHVLSHLLTDEEKEYLIARFQQFQSSLSRFSSQNLLKLASKSEDEGKSQWCKHKGTCIHNSLRGFLKCFGVSFAGKYVLSTLPLLLRGRVFSQPGLLLKHARSSDTFRFALFLGSFIGSFKGLLCLLRRMRGLEDGWNSFVAGFLSSFTILLDYSHRRTAIALFLAMRTAQYSVGYLVAKGYLPRIPNFDAILMGLASSQIIYAYVNAQSTIPKQYLDFLIVQGGIRTRFPGYELQALQMMKSVISGDVARQREIVSSSPPIARQLKGSQELQSQPVICQLLHGHTLSCSRYHGEFFLECLPRGLRLYLPLNLITGIVFRHKALLKDPKKFLMQWLQLSSRSTLFLSTFCTVCYIVVCHARKLVFAGREHWQSYYVNGFLAGLCIMIESKGKRIEFAMYCLPRAIESLWQMLLERRVVRNIKHGEIVYFSFAMGILTFLYQNDPDSIQENYRGLLTRFFGKN